MTPTVRITPAPAGGEPSSGWPEAGAPEELSEEETLDRLLELNLAYWYAEMIYRSAAYARCPGVALLQTIRRHLPECS